MPATTASAPQSTPHRSDDSDRARLCEEIAAGLRQTPRRIDPKFFYDERGSALFEQIVQLPEYYPFRCEQQILRRYAAAIAAHIGPGCVLIEPGSGASHKVELLLDALRPSAYVALDISAEQVRAAGLRLAERYPWLRCHAIAADYSRPLQLPPTLPARRRVLFYPGSTLGNFEPAAARGFLRQLRALAGSGGGLLIGIDLQKDKAILEPAYDDADGITAAFNRNALRHINRLTGADFDPEGFDHVAFYNGAQQRIEMHLRARREQRVTLGGELFRFAAGECIHTENSYKYTLDSFTALAAQAGFAPAQSWCDDAGLFSVHYLLAGEG